MRCASWQREVRRVSSASAHSALNRVGNEFPVSISFGNSPCWTAPPETGSSGGGPAQAPADYRNGEQSQNRRVDLSPVLLAFCQPLAWLCRRGGATIAGLRLEPESGSSDGISAASIRCRKFATPPPRLQAQSGSNYRDLPLEMPEPRGSSTHAIRGVPTRTVQPPVYIRQICRKSGSSDGPSAVASRCPNVGQPPALAVPPPRPPLAKVWQAHYISGVAMCLSCMQPGPEADAIQRMTRKPCGRESVRVAGRRCSKSLLVPLCSGGRREGQKQGDAGARTRHPRDRRGARADHGARRRLRAVRARPDRQHGGEQTAGQPDHDDDARGGRARLDADRRRQPGGRAGGHVERSRRDHPGRREAAIVATTGRTSRPSSRCGPRRAPCRASWRRCSTISASPSGS